MRTTDATTAFVQADIDRPVFLKGLKGWYDLPEGNCLELLKCNYGLHQSSRQWYLTCDAFMKEIGMKKSIADP